MSDKLNTFLKAVLTGDRFRDGGVPVEVLEEFQRYRDFVVDVAKSIFYDQHPERERVPKGFVDDFRLQLTDVDDGSAAPVLSRRRPVDAASNGDQISVLEREDEFRHARDLIWEVVKATVEDEDLLDEFPDKHLNHSTKFGKTLRDDECLQFRRDGEDTGAELTVDVRRRLLALVDEQYEEEVDLVGPVVETHN